MKKRFKNLLCFLAAALMISITAGAEEGNMQINWSGDYKSNELVVSIQSPVNYLQQVTVVMYPANINEPVFTDYCRTEEITVQGKKEAEIRFKISDSLNADGGAYKICVQGNGYLSGISYAEENVWLLRPSDISDGNGDGLLKQINSASADNVKPYIDKISKALKLTVKENESEKRLNDFIRIKNDDYNGAFKTINEVADAWRISDVIEYLSLDNPDSYVLESKISEISSIISINMNDGIYNTYREDIYKNIILINKTFNGGSGISSRGDIETVFSQARVLAVINGSAESELENNIKSYYRELNIDADTYNKFAECKASDRQKILRQIYNKSFTSTEQVKKAFTDAVKRVTESSSDGNTTPSGSQGGSGSSGGSGSGSSFGGGGYSINEGQDNTIKPDTAFSDCDKSHWAYTYVNEMKNDGIISGYSDGNFYPEQSVKREEFVKMAVMASGLYSEEYECDFDDVPYGEWYYKFIASANNSNIINGIGEKEFGVGQEIKREDVAVIVYRILNMFNSVKENENVSIGDEKDFTDSADISEYAKESIEILTEMKILNGFEDGSFKPQNRLSRAEAAKIIYMFKGYIRK